MHGLDVPEALIGGRAEDEVGVVGVRLVAEAHAGCDVRPPFRLVHPRPIDRVRQQLRPNRPVESIGTMKRLLFARSINQNATIRRQVSIKTCSIWSVLDVDFN